MAQINATSAGRPRVSIPAGILLTCLVVLLAQPALALTPIAQFRENRADANGDYLWSYSENWMWANTGTISGLPRLAGQVEVGDDHSGPVECVMDVPFAQTYGCEIAEGYAMGRTAGSKITIRQGSTWECYAPFQVGKDDKGFLDVEGTLKIKTSMYSMSNFYVGDFGHSNARGTVYVGSTGTIQSNGEVYILGIRTKNYQRGSDDSIPPERDYGSSVTVDGGTFLFSKQLKLYSGIASCPGTLRLKGNATLTQESGSNALNAIGGGVLEIDGGSANIHVRRMTFQGGRDHYGAYNPAVLKLTGNGISTIYNSGSTTLGYRSILDVSELHVAPGTYTVINGASINAGGLSFASGIDLNDWSFSTGSGDLLLTYDPAPEPAGLALLCIGGVTLLRRRRRA